MIDSGATGIFVSEKFVSENHVVRKPMKHLIVLYNIDGSKNKAGSIMHYATLRLQVGTFDKYVDCYVTNISNEDLILGIPWLREVNPDINWKSGSIMFNGEMQETSLPEDGDTPFQKIGATQKLRRKWKREGIFEDVTEELWCCAGVTYSTELAAQAHQSKSKKTFERRWFQSHTETLRKSSPKENPNVSRITNLGTMQSS